jgi:hypothetical protein
MNVFAAAWNRAPPPVGAVTRGTHASLAGKVIHPNVNEY